MYAQVLGLLSQRFRLAAGRIPGQARTERLLRRESVYIVRREVAADVSLQRGMRADIHHHQRIALGPAPLA